jgi:hypothetical protein
MKLELNQDVLIWLDSVRGEVSRQKYIVKLLRNSMLETSSNKENYEILNSNGASKPLPPVSFC